MKSYIYVKDAPKIYVYYKTEKMSVDISLQAGTIGSIISDGEGKSGSGITAGGIAIGGGIGIVLGTLLGMLIMYLSRRKKVAVVETDEREE